MYISNGRPGHRVRSALLVILSLGFVFAAAKADVSTLQFAEILDMEPSFENGREIFAQCTRCHGTEGWGAYSGDYPQIAGQHNSVLIKQLIDIQSGERDNPVMLPAVNALMDQGPQALADVAAYTAALMMNPDPDVGEFDDSELVQEAEIYGNICSGCHGQAGQGDARNIVPLLQGQNYTYLLRQLKRIQAGTRKNANPEMRKLIGDFSLQQLDKMATYLSRLEPPETRLAPYGWVNPDFQ